jgi:hypothetical protein
MAIKAKKRIVRSRAFWVDVVAEYERSGLSLGAFARETGLKPTTLNRWIKRVRPVQPKPEFVELLASVVAPCGEPVGGAITSRLVFGCAALEFSELPPVGYIAALLREVAA